VTSFDLTSYGRALIRDNDSAGGVWLYGEATTAVTVDETGSTKVVIVVVSL
jgi:hypothetical protein